MARCGLTVVRCGGVSSSLATRSKLTTDSLYSCGAGAWISGGDLPHFQLANGPVCSKSCAALQKFQPNWHKLWSCIFGPKTTLARNCKSRLRKDLETLNRLANRLMAQRLHACVPALIVLPDGRIGPKAGEPWLLGKPNLQEGFHWLEMVRRAVRK